MIFPLEVTASGEKFDSCIVSSEEYYCLNFAIYCVCWCYFYTVKQQPCRRINNLIIKLKKKKDENLVLNAYLYKANRAPTVVVGVVLKPPTVTNRNEVYVKTEAM